MADTRGYCICCRKKVALKDRKLAYYKNGTPVEKGICTECGSKVCRILTREERVALRDNQFGKQEKKK